MIKFTHSALKLFTITSLLFSSHVYAQESNCNTFMIGNHVEMGVNWNGAFGASTAPPVGSHANTSASLHNRAVCTGGLYTGTSLGIVADPDQTGWATYYGDFVLPGGAKEGWSIMFDGNQKNAWNSDAATQDSINNVSSYIYSYSDTLGTIETKTQAVFNGMYITQWIDLDTSKLFFTVSVLIENTTLGTMGDMYYMRSINPHNDQSITGNPNTWNKIMAQNPDTGNRAIVSARGTVHNNAFLAMGTKDDRALAFITKHSQLPDANTLDYLYAIDTNLNYTVNDSVNSNASIGLIYQIGQLVSGGSSYFTFFYAFRPDVIDDAIYNSHLAVNNVKITAPHYHVYPNPITNSFKLLGIEQGDVVMLYDMIGRQMVCNKLAPNEYGISDIAAGTYTVIIKDKNGMVKGRVPVMKN